MYVAFFNRPGDADRAVRRLRQAGYLRARITLGHARPGEPDLELGPRLAITDAAALGLEPGREHPAREEAGA